MQAKTPIKHQKDHIVEHMEHDEVLSKDSTKNIQETQKAINLLIVIN